MHYEYESLSEQQNSLKERKSTNANSNVSRDKKQRSSPRKENNLSYNTIRSSRSLNREFEHSN